MPDADATHSPQLAPLGIPTQGELIPVEELDDGFWRAEDTAGRYTARRFFLKRPDDYRRCIDLIAAGAGLLKIASILKIHHRTVAAVRDAESANIDIVKQRIRSNLRLALEVGSERLADEISNIPIGQLPVATAIIADKLAQMDGEPTSRVEVTHKVALTHESVLAELNAFPEEAEEADFTPTTDSAGEKSAQKALGALSATPANPPPASPAKQAKPDNKSV